MIRGESYTLNSSTKELIQDAASVLVNKLAAAIQAGENDQAKQIVDKLASLKLKLDISIPKDENEQRSKEKEFSIRVHVEDRVSEGCYFNLMVKACDTITDLKRKVMLIHDFPMEVQRWIIGKKIFSDTDKLGQCGVKASNHTIYLYLVTARSVGLNQQSYQQERQSLIEGRALQPLALSQEGDDSCAWTPLQQGLEELEHTIVHSGMASRQASKASLTSSSSLLQELVSNNALQHSPPPNAASERPRSVRTESMLLEQSNFSSGYRSKTPPRSPSAVKKNEPVGWQCSICTLINLPIRPGCEACAAPRPSNYCIPPGYQLTPEELALYEKEQQMERLTREAEETVKQQNFQMLMEMDDQDLVSNVDCFECPICFDEIDDGDGIVLRECLHSFCKPCLLEAVRHTEDAIVKCPYQDNVYSCQSVLQEREIKALVPVDIFERFLQRGLDQAESRMTNAYHCKTADCHGWCIYEDLVNFFKCPVCEKENCLTCKAIHENMNCKEYQDGLKLRALNDASARQTQELLQQLVKDGEAMHCPQCSIIVQKKGGCDWIKCSICKLEICWVTKGPRWGPKGEGDITGGCKCRVNQTKCHPQCINCH
ncbi:ranBP-type and C3HC4-type zinc finger-containing protein 1-like [Biomphalaria glabrata]|uniref:RanBP-type and C3HC4-type zinc finger-containing protein 1 n=1 Tax=Biomphalaria glabrata TaxID=6526 RepID=A0A9W3AZ43_BIOGL|nr:ranBP-type and C3HC4-type zinc finger-containing protein 1-like [Biomphalaria glabrata]XP_055892491.1 ranBP-type and C3HC4-type zinc finger-containing protein 1-like [Biomphalaria glabrata]XP_055892492.1 ranBP-type and C3HC4-type zinc finger-containing protein 1-like [Biomphalaria glabrata]